MRESFGREYIPTPDTKKEKVEQKEAKMFQAETSRLRRWKGKLAGAFLATSSFLMMSCGAMNEAQAQDNWPTGMEHVEKTKENLSFAYPQGRGPFRGNLSEKDCAEIHETTIPAPGTYVFPALNKRLVVVEIENPVLESGDNFPPGEFLDSALFSFPLTLRMAKTGDRFHPLGAPGSKKVSGFLSDLKINRHERRVVPVLSSGDSILALPGLRIDHRFRVTEKTSRAIKVSWEDITGVDER